jgi:hypothetical protein
MASRSWYRLVNRPSTYITGRSREFSSNSSKATLLLVLACAQTANGMTWTMAFSSVASFKIMSIWPASLRAAALLVHDWLIEQR